MDVILTILNILLIIVISVIALALLLVLAILFVPIRYKVLGEGEKPVFAGSFKASWLLHIASFSYIIEEKGTTRTIRIFGIPVNKVFKEAEPKEEDNKDTADKIVDFLLKVTGKDGDYAED